jgi:hypothetical protein
MHSRHPTNAASQLTRFHQPSRQARLHRLNVLGEFRTVHVKVALAIIQGQLYPGDATDCVSITIAPLDRFRHNHSVPTHSALPAIMLQGIMVMLAPVMQRKVLLHQRKISLNA